MSTPKVPAPGHFSEEMTPPTPLLRATFPAPELAQKGAELSRQIFERLHELADYVIESDADTELRRLADAVAAIVEVAAPPPRPDRGALFERAAIAVEARALAFAAQRSSERTGATHRAAENALCEIVKVEGAGWLLSALLDRLPLSEHETLSTALRNAAATERKGGAR